MFNMCATHVQKHNNSIVSELWKLQAVHGYQMTFFFLLSLLILCFGMLSKVNIILIYVSSHTVLQNYLNICLVFKFFVFVLFCLFWFCFVCLFCCWWCCCCGWEEGKWFIRFFKRIANVIICVKLFSCFCQTHVLSLCERTYYPRNICWNICWNT